MPPTTVVASPACGSVRSSPSSGAMAEIESLTLYTIAAVVVAAVAVPVVRRVGIERVLSAVGMLMFVASLALAGLAFLHILDVE